MTKATLQSNCSLVTSLLPHKCEGQKQGACEIESVSKHIRMPQSFLQIGLLVAWRRVSSSRDTSHSTSPSLPASSGSFTGRSILLRCIASALPHGSPAMFSYIFGTSNEGRSPPSIQEGHKAVEVVIDGERLKVDVDVLADVSGLFLQVQSTDAKECPLLDFPGGLERFRDIVGFLVDGETLAVTEETVLDLMEATWLLECPRLLDDVMESPFSKSLSSRRRAEILEHILPYTAASSPADSEHAADMLACRPDDENVLGSWNEHGMLNSQVLHPSLACGQFLRLFQFETLMWQTTERAAITPLGLEGRLSSCFLVRRFSGEATRPKHHSSKARVAAGLWGLCFGPTPGHRQPSGLCRTAPTAALAGGGGGLRDDRHAACERPVEASWQQAAGSSNTPQLLRGICLR